LAWRLFFVPFIDDGEIEQAAVPVDVGDGDGDFGSDRIESVFWAIARPSHPLVVEPEFAIREVFGLDEAADLQVDEFDEEAISSHVPDDGGEGLVAIAIDEVLEIFELLHSAGFDFRFSRVAFGCGDMVGHCGHVFMVWRFALKLWAVDGEVAENAVDDEVGIAADGACEVGIVGFGEAVMAARFGIVNGAFEAFEEPYLDRVFGWVPLDCVE